MLAVQPRRMRLLSLIAVAALTACSSSSIDEGNKAGAVPAAFGAYCTGTLKVAHEFMTPSGAAAWMGIGATLPAGTTVLLSTRFSKFAAYAFLPDGKPARIDGDDTKGLVPDVDFTSTCTDRVMDPKNERTVLLQTSTFHADAALSGTACTLPAGQVLTNLSYMSTGEVGQISSNEIRATCSIDKAYSNDVVYATLIAL